MVFHRRRQDDVALNIEPIHYLPEDIICPGSEEEDSSDEHISKRQRRIEASARQYLRGQPLIIQTASLRGPLHKDWTNPWARKSSYSANDIRRFPQASKKVFRNEVIPEAHETGGVAPRNTSLIDTSYDRSNRRRDSAGVEPRGRLDSPSKQRRLEEADLQDSRLKSKSKSPGYTLQKGDRDHWLRKTSIGQQPSFEDRKSPTPTPAPKDLARPTTTPYTPSRPQTNANAFNIGSRSSENPTSPHNQQSGFTPINGKDTGSDDRPPRTRRKEPDTPRKGYGVRVRERSLPKVDDIAKGGYDKVKSLARDAVRTTQNKEGHIQARKLAQEAAERGIESQRSPQRLAPYVSAFEIINDEDGNAAWKNESKSPRTSMYAVPPSTYLPGFEYRYARKTSSSSSRGSTPFVEAPERLHKAALASRSSSSSETSRSAEVPEVHPKEHKHAEGRLSSEEIRRLTFTASGGPKIAQGRSRQHLTSDQGGLSKELIKTSELQLKTDISSRSSNLLPEAQVVPDAQLSKVPSGPSTNLLETDSQLPSLPNLDEGDSYVNLSTQAAITKAQRSFQNEMLFSLNHSLQTTKKDTRRLSTNNDEQKISPIANGHGPRNNLNRQSPDNGPLSTQAMLDDLSPFAVTTIKRRPLKPQNHPLTFPTHPPKFPTLSPNMSTSPSPSPPLPSPQPIPSHPPASHPTSSKPPSTLTSFSILPNGTLTETNIYHQDGQQQFAPPAFEHLDCTLPEPFDLSSGNNNTNNNENVVNSGEGNGEEAGRGDGDGIREEKEKEKDVELDLDDAIEEAGSFLGEWDVDAEARKEGAGGEEEGEGLDALEVEM